MIFLFVKFLFLLRLDGPCLIAACDSSSAFALALGMGADLSAATNLCKDITLTKSYRVMAVFLLEFASCASSNTCDRHSRCETTIAVLGEDRLSYIALVLFMKALAMLMLYRTTRRHEWK
jgi:hypothetical protein